MTTTPTASAGLPDLARLEALARAADEGEGQHIYTNPRDSNGWQANEAWHRAASPAAVLALIALARCAQPESEAPQAVPAIWVQYIDGMKTQNVARDDKEKATVESIHRTMAPGTKMTWRAFYDHAPAATLSPLCGAQHAESGKEAYQVFSHDSGEWYGVDKAQYDRAHDSCRRVLAAQQAAAPGALAERWSWSKRGMEMDPNGHYAAYSAPGTPEAPADRHPVQPLIEDEHGRARFKENAIVRHLSEGKLNELAVIGFPEADWEQFAQLIGYSLDGFGTLSYVTDETYNRAAAQPVLQRAAQLDGGQGEGQ